MAFINIETRVVSNKFIPTVICFYDAAAYYTFLQLSELFKFLFNKGEKRVVYVHNIDFAGVLIIEYLSKVSVAFDIFTIKTSIYYIRITGSSCSIEFRCSFKLLPRPLTDIAKKFLNEPSLVYPHKVLTKKKIQNKVTAADFNTESEYNTYVQLTGGAAFNY